MSSTFHKPGDVLDVVLAANATAGTPFMVGGLLVVPITSGSTGETVACEITGVHLLQKVTGSAWTHGQKLYWDVVNLKVTHTDNSAANPRIGSAALAAGSSATTGYVLLGHF